MLQLTSLVDRINIKLDEGRLKDAVILNVTKPSAPYGSKLSSER
jgi:hypothetical protein